MDFKKLAGQAGQLLTRAVQYTEEKLGSAEKTEFDGHYDSLIQQYDSTKLWTEKLMAGAQAVLIPNPGNRVEDMLFEKIEKRRPNRLSNLEYLGLDMVQAGNEFGSGTAYGSALLKVGGAEQRLGLAEREFVSNAIEGFVQPLHKFLDTEIKTIARERRVLDTKRLDLDACKSRLRKARNMDAQAAQKDNVDPKILVTQAEAELRKAQAEFDRQTEIVKLLLEGVRSSQASHLRYLNELVEAQVQFHEQSHNIMTDLQKDLSSLSLSDGLATTTPAPAGSPGLYPSLDRRANGSATTTTTPETSNCSGSTSTDGPWRKAKVVCDYEATSKEEINLKMNEAVEFKDKAENVPPEFVLVQKGTNVGRVPKAYIEPLDD